MSVILYDYQKVNPTSWAYLSSLLMLALFFKFNRAFSVRNLDLFLLISLAPGLLLVQYSIENDGIRANAVSARHLGFLWLFAVSALLMARLLLDSAMVRRPLLEPNLNAAGLAFLTSSLLFFMMANVMTGQPTPVDVSPALAAPKAEGDKPSAEAIDAFESQGPGFRLLYSLPRISTQTVVRGSEESPPETQAAEEEQRHEVGVITARIMAILSHVLIVSGVVLIGGRHFGNVTAGIAVATIYLLLPYTASWSGKVTHALPAALLVWAVALYRRPLLAGVLIGLASGTIYYPIFLIFLWCSFYWERGVKRFLSGVLISIAALVLTLYFTTESIEVFLRQVWQMFGVRPPKMQNLQGIWRDDFWNPLYRLPILFGFLALAISFVTWPPRKHLGTLISCTAALMVGVQFWHAHGWGGGVYVAWYLPLLLLTIFRPNLEDRVASAVVPEGWWDSRRRAIAHAPLPTTAPGDLSEQA
jgi:hypothetical protein